MWIPRCRCRPGWLESLPRTVAFCIESGHLDFIHERLIRSYSHWYPPTVIFVPSYKNLKMYMHRFPIQPQSRCVCNNANWLIRGRIPVPNVRQDPFSFPGHIYERPIITKMFNSQLYWQIDHLKINCPHLLFSTINRYKPFILLK